MRFFETRAFLDGAKRRVLRASPGVLGRWALPRKIL